MTTQLADLIGAPSLTKLTLGTVSGQTATLTIKGLASNAYRQSAKIDLGANWGGVAGTLCEFEAVLLTQFAAAPTAGTTLDLWVGFSDSATAATDNWAGCTGADATYSGYSGGSAAQSVLQLDRVGSLKLDATTGAQYGIVGSFVPRSRYACFVLFNNAAGQSTDATDAHHQLELWPLCQRIEAAA